MQPRRLLFAALAPLAAFVATQGSRAEEICEPHGPPSQLTLEIKNFGAIDHYIELNWEAWPPPPTEDSLRYTFVRWEVQRSTDGGDFAALADGDPAFGVNPHEAVGYALNYVREPADCTGTCALPGHSYSFRVRAHYQYGELCEQAGAAASTEFSNTATITVPLDPSACAPPQDVIAVSELKKPRVHVRWKPPPECVSPEKYSIERRIVPSGDQKSDADFVKIGEASKDKTEFFDEFALADEINEYRVVAEALTGANKSDADAAYPLPGEKCAVSKLDLWSGKWDLDIGGVSHTLDVVLGADTIVALLRDGSPTAGGGGALRVTSLASRLRIDRTAFAAVSEVRQADAGRPEWAKDLKVGQLGELRLDLTPPNPFDPDAFVAVKGTIRFKKGPRLPVAGRRVIAETTYANVCSSVGAGVGKSANGKYALKLGKFAIVVLDVMPIDFPLLPGRAAVDLTIDNGEVVLLAELTDNVRPVGGDPAGKSAVRFELGGIGASKKGVPQRARIVLAVTPAAVGKGQMTCTFDLVQIQATSFPAQIVNFTNKDKRRVVEFLVLPPG
jgi:hypothetical protein